VLPNDYSWPKATNGKNGSFQDAGACSGGQQTFTAPDNGDWALRIVKKNGSPRAFLRKQERGDGDFPLAFSAKLWSQLGQFSKYEAIFPAEF